MVPNACILHDSRFGNLLAEASKGPCAQFGGMGRCLRRRRSQSAGDGCLLGRHRVAGTMLSAAPACMAPVWGTLRPFPLLGLWQADKSSSRAQPTPRCPPPGGAQQQPKPWPVGQGWQKWSREEPGLPGLLPPNQQLHSPGQLESTHASLYRDGGWERAPKRMARPRPVASSGAPGTERAGGAPRSKPPPDDKVESIPLASETISSSPPLPRLSAGPGPWALGVRCAAGRTGTAGGSTVSPDCFPGPSPSPAGCPGQACWLM